MRMELGSFKIVLDPEDDREAVFRWIFRNLSNKELGEILGVTEKTVRRWKVNGRLPCRENGRIMLLDLVHHLAPKAAKGE